MIAAYKPMSYGSCGGPGMSDTEMIDWLEARINEEGAIHLHDGEHPHGLGIGLRPGQVSRTLRQAIAQAAGWEPTSDRPQRAAS